MSSDKVKISPVSRWSNVMIRINQLLVFHNREDGDKCVLAEHCLMLDKCSN